MRSGGGRLGWGVLVAVVALARPAAARPDPPRLVWELPGIVPGALVTFGNGLVIQQDDGRLALVDVTSGRPVWRSEPVPQKLRRCARIGERLLVTADGPSLFALAGDDGRRLWSTGANCDVVVGTGDRGAALCDRRRLRVGPGSHTDLVGLNLATGALGWRIAGAGTDITVVEDRVMTLDFPGDEDERLLRVTARGLDDGRPRWSATVDGLETWVFAPVGRWVLLLGRGHDLFGPAGEVVSLRYLDLELFTGFGHDRVPAVKDDKLLAVTSDGTVAALDPATQALTPVAKLPEGFPRSRERRDQEPEIHAHGGRVVVLADNPGNSTSTAVTWEGERPVLFTVPTAAQNITAHVGDHLVIRTRDRRLQAYALAAAPLPTDAEPAHSVALRIASRLFGAIEPEDLAELRARPETRVVLEEMAADRTLPERRGGAIELLGRLGWTSSRDLFFSALDERGPNSACVQQAAIAALIALPEASVTRRLAPLLGADFPDCPGSPSRGPLRAGLYRVLARVGGPGEIAQMVAFERGHQSPTGWSSVCDGEVADGPDYDAGKGIMGGLCPHSTVGPFRLGGQYDELWLRRRSATGWSPPAFAGRADDDMDRARWVAGRVRVTTGSRDASGKRPRIDIDPATVFVDGDGDGVTDGTERLLGTDPGRPDSDGDGRRDGEDFAPLHALDASPAGQVRAAVLSYALMFHRWFSGYQRGGMLGLRTDAAALGPVAAPRSVILPGRPGLPTLVIESVTATPSEGSAVLFLDWVDARERQRLTARPVGDRWRVVDAAPVP